LVACICPACMAERRKGGKAERRKGGKAERRKGQKHLQLQLATAHGLISIWIYIGPAGTYTRACMIVKRMRTDATHTDEEQA
jgi:hypothetical protein